MPLIESREWNGRQYCGVKKENIPVVCKCPKCERKHVVMHYRKPAIMPRISCKNCYGAFHDPNFAEGMEDMRGCASRTNTAHKAKRAAK